MSQDYSAVQQFVLGGAIAIASQTLTRPLTNIKSIQQSRQSVLDSPKYDSDKIPQYLKKNESTVTLIKNIIQDKGVLGLFYGNTYNILRYFPTQAANYAIKDKIQSLLPVTATHDSFVVKLWKNVASGGIAGIISLFFVYPIDVMEQNKIVDYYFNQQDKNDTNTNNMPILQYFSGFGISIIGICAYRGIYFGLYETLKPYLHPDGPVYMSKNKPAQTFLLGFGLTVCAGLITYPLDTIRKRQLLLNESVGDAYNNLKAKGMSSFYEGAPMNILTGIIGAVVLATVSGMINKNVKK